MFGFKGENGAVGRIGLLGFTGEIGFNGFNGSFMEVSILPSVAHPVIRIAINKKTKLIFIVLDCI